MSGAMLHTSGTLLAVVGLLLLLLALHPFTSYPLSLRVLAKLRPSNVKTAPFQGRVALCVCAYNEEQIIEAKVRNMLAMRAAVSTLEILVYVDGSSDRTAEILEGYGDQITLVASAGRHGKTHGMNTLVGRTDAELIVFSDANVMFAADAIPRLLAPFAQATVGVTCGHLRYTQPDGSTTAQAGSLYWRLEEKIKALESETGSVMGADGSIFALRRALYVPSPADLIDDMYTTLSILCDGSRIVRVPDAYAYEASVSQPGEEFRRKIRIACQAFNVHRALWPRLRRMPWLDCYKYVSHKLIRWLVIYLLVAGTVAELAGLTLASAYGAAATLLALGLVGLAAIWLVRAGPFAVLRDVLSAFVATGIGVFRSFRGDRFQTWAPPASAREARVFEQESERV